MKGVAAFFVLVLLAVIACGVGGSIMSPRLENVAIYALDSHYAAQQNPVAVLERQMDAMQANSPSNAPGFPWSLLFITVGLALLILAYNYERILSAKTAYLKERIKNDRAAKSGSGSRPQLRTLTPITPIRPLNPYQFEPQPPRPVLPPSVDDGDDERW